MLLLFYFSCTKVNNDYAKISIFTFQIIKFINWIIFWKIIKINYTITKGYINMVIFFKISHFIYFDGLY